MINKYIGVKKTELRIYLHNEDKFIFLYHLLYFISYLIAAHVLIPACFLNKLIHLCRVNKVIIIIIIIIIIKLRRFNC